MRGAVLTWAAAVAEGGAAARDASVDANRLRRMDRFGRSGVLAGSRALAAAGRAPASPAAEPDPRFGVVVGTAFGCRDAITKHERLLATASKVEDLAPSVFVATVHNAVCGELAIIFGLGGVAETLVSGRTAGLEALVLAARRVAGGDADRILVVAAEGLDAAMRGAWERENPGRALVESAAAVLVEAEAGEGEKGKKEEEISSRGRVGARLVHSSLTFDVAARRGAFEENRRNEDFFEGVGDGGVRGGGGAVIERLGASGLWEIAEDLAALASSEAATGGAPAADALRDHSPSKKIRNRRYTAHDVHGSSAAVTLEFFS